MNHPATTYPLCNPSRICSVGTGGRCARGHLRTPEIVPQNRHNFHSNSTGKERDEETGYSYFSARYLDHTLLTGFLSVDRYADKYPSISPYAYCAWNPLRLIDPSGDTVILSGDANLVDKALTQIRERSSSLYFSVEENGRLNAVQRSGTELTDDDKYMLNIINSDKVNVNLLVKDNDDVSKNLKIKYGGSYCGNNLKYNNNNDIIGVDCIQAINVNTLGKLDRLTWSTGELIWHEISESYEGGLIAINNKWHSTPSSEPGTTYKEAHCAANRHFLGDIGLDEDRLFPAAIFYNNCK